jgi:hypothetical protein
VRWLERHAWWGLVVIALIFVIFGVTDVVVGPAADTGIPLGLTGMSLEQLQAEGPNGYRLFDFFTRANGASLALAGLLMTAILLFAFRRNERWAWWAAWLMPIWMMGTLAFYLVAGTRPDQPPPPPMISAPVIGIIWAAILAVSAPRFIGRHAPGEPAS